MALPTRVNRNVGGTAVDPVELFQREFDGMFNRWMGGRDAGNGAALAPYGVDIREDADHFYVEAELPGFKKDEVDITLENQTLTIAAERQSETSRAAMARRATCSCTSGAIAASSAASPCPRRSTSSPSTPSSPTAS